MSDIFDLPLSGIRVLSIEQFGAGPWATMQLADLGADVIKIEDPASDGDVGRTVPPYRAGETSLFFEALNRGKRSLALDLRLDEGLRVLHDLVAEADVVFSNLRGDQPERLGLRYDRLSARNPAIVCCALTGFGMTGPRAAQPAYDYVIQGLAGWMQLTGEPGAPPTKTGLSLVDFAGGYVAALAVMAGLWRARRTGRGCDCDISLFETGLSLLNYVGTWAASRDDYQPTRTRHSAHPSIVPFQAVPVRDGWIVVACAKETFWQRLCKAAGRVDLLDDPRFEGFAGRHEHREALLEELYRTFQERDAAEWLDILEEAGVPCGPVNDVRAALADPQAVARGVIQTMPHPELGEVRHIATPLRLDADVPAPAPAPLLGEHSADVLAEVAQYDADAIRALDDAGAAPGAAGPRGRR